MLRRASAQDARRTPEVQLLPAAIEREAIGRTRCKRAQSDNRTIGQGRRRPTPTRQRRTAYAERVVTTTPKRHHTVSAGYIGRFAHNRRVSVHQVTGGVSEIGPRAVGYQNDFWGSDELATEVEQGFNKVENPVLRLLRNLPGRWPLSTEDRGALVL